MDLSQLDDDRLVWQVPGDLGLEIAARWRRLNDTIERLRKEQDAMIDYGISQIGGDDDEDEEEWVATLAGHTLGFFPTKDAARAEIRRTLGLDVHEGRTDR